MGVAQAAHACRVYFANARPAATPDDLIGPSSFAYLLGPDGATLALSSGQPSITAALFSSGARVVRRPGVPAARVTKR